MRLQKFLAECGVASRRHAEEIIASGRVDVNGARATVGQSIDPTHDEVALDGQRVIPEEKIYLVLHKPRGVITAVTDSHNRPTVISCLPDSLSERVFPVGRLDLDVEGALLLTNDGELAFKLTHPRFGVEKVYLVRVRGAVGPEAIERLERGVALDDGMTAPARASVVERGERETLLRLVLREGRKREVKRMCAAVGHPVLELQRVAFGGIGVRGLRPGQWRHLNDAELNRLRRQAEPDQPGMK